MLQHKQTTDYHQSPSIRGFCSTCFPSVAAPLAPVTGAVKSAQWWPGRNTEIHCEEFWDYRKPETRLLELIPSCPMEKQQKMVKRENFPQCNTHPSGRKQPELVQTCSQSASQPVNMADACWMAGKVREASPTYRLLHIAVTTNKARGMFFGEKDTVALTNLIIVPRVLPISSNTVLLTFHGGVTRGRWNTAPRVPQKHSSRDGHMAGVFLYVKSILVHAWLMQRETIGLYITYSLLFKKELKHFNIGNPNTNTENELTRPYQRLSYFSDPVRFPTSSGHGQQKCSLVLSKNLIMHISYVALPKQDAMFSLPLLFSSS